VAAEEVMHGIAAEVEALSRPNVIEISFPIVVAHARAGGSVSSIETETLVQRSTEPSVSIAEIMTEPQREMLVVVIMTSGKEISLQVAVVLVIVEIRLVRSLRSVKIADTSLTTTSFGSL